MKDCVAAFLAKYYGCLQQENYSTEMDFLRNYIIDHDYTTKKYPTTEQKARCGNAVFPILPKVLVQANKPELCGNILEEVV
jgi:DNA (cytosine-5)-methyltransferase 1